MKLRLEQGDFWTDSTFDLALGRRNMKVVCDTRSSGHGSTYVHMYRYILVVHMYWYVLVCTGSTYVPVSTFISRYLER